MTPEQLAHPALRGIHGDIEVTSSYILPNRQLTTTEREAWIADYFAMGGPTQGELDFIRLLNEYRVGTHNLTALQMCYSMMMAARLYTQYRADVRVRGYTFDGGHRGGPYGGGRIMARDHFGFNTGNSTSGMGAPGAGILMNWQRSQAHHMSLIGRAITHVGIGSFPGGETYAFYINNNDSFQRTAPCPWDCCN